MVFRPFPSADAAILELSYIEPKCYVYKLCDGEDDMAVIGDAWRTWERRPAPQRALTSHVSHKAKRGIRLSARRWLSSC
jgi:hypothetical protein